MLAMLRRARRPSMANEPVATDVPITDGELSRMKSQFTSVLLKRFLARIDRDAARITELERITGPVMPCGCRAVKFTAHHNLPRFVLCRKHEMSYHVTPEYLAWMESR